MAFLADFKCLECDSIFEDFVKEEIKCPYCLSKNVNKMISAPAQLITNCADAPKHRSSKRFRK